MFITNYDSEFHNVTITKDLELQFTTKKQLLNKTIYYFVDYGFGVTTLTEAKNYTKIIFHKDLYNTNLFIKDKGKTTHRKATNDEIMKLLQ